MGILTCGQLKTTPESMLIANFGRTIGSWLYQALRTDGNPAYKKNAPHTAEPLKLKSIGHSYTLPAEIYNRNIAFSWLRMLSEMVAQRARKNRCQGKTISLWINSKNESLVRQKTFSIPTNDGWEIFVRSRALFGQKKGIFRPVRAIGVTLSGLVFDETPPLLAEQKRRGALLMAQDKINAKYGDWTIAPAILAETHPK
jgi:nucleotidyltransferase/DNA polymerase involved in DNA repair